MIKNFLKFIKLSLAFLIYSSFLFTTNIALASAAISIDTFEKNNYENLAIVKIKGFILQSATFNKDKNIYHLRVYATKDPSLVNNKALKIELDQNQFEALAKLIKEDPLNIRFTPPIWALQTIYQDSTITITWNPESGITQYSKKKITLTVYKDGREEITKQPTEGIYENIENGGEVYIGPSEQTAAFDLLRAEMIKNNYRPMAPPDFSKQEIIEYKNKAKIYISDLKKTQINRQLFNSNQAFVFTLKIKKEIEPQTAGRKIYTYWKTLSFQKNNSR